MTRPKVPPELRQRIPQACESCKRRKQKCDGLYPCSTCAKRNFTCLYATQHSPTSDSRAVKKRALSSKASATEGHRQTPQPQYAHDVALIRQSSNSWSQRLTPTLTSTNRDVCTVTPSEESVTQASLSPTTKNVDVISALKAGEAALPCPKDENEAVRYTQSGMLQDATGRFFYVGGSAALSFLQSVRKMVENVAGPSPFTTDPRGAPIVECQSLLPPGVPQIRVLPDLTTTTILVDAFFINTHGFIHVFNHQRFLEDVERFFSEPLSTEPSWLCILYLVMAIGLALASPMSGSAEAVIVDKLRSEHTDRAEVFYLSAKELYDPFSSMEDHDVASVQALLLMAVYMLARSRQNSSFKLLGMATRSAQSLGLHREETLAAFELGERHARINLWRSIFVVDCLLSCALGRPAAISAEDCSGDLLPPEETRREDDIVAPENASYHSIGAKALESAVRSCVTISLILKTVYHRGKVGVVLVQEISDTCKEWPRYLTPELHWRHAPTAAKSQGVAILHPNLFYCHSIILLTRPFFTHSLETELQRQTRYGVTSGLDTGPISQRAKFSEACVVASTHTMLLVQNAFDAGHLTRRNPVVIYFLYAAALVLLANEFAGLYQVEASETRIIKAINFMSYCAESDEQAGRLLSVLTSFRDVVAAQKLRRNEIHPQADMTTLPSISSQLYGACSNHQDRPGSVEMGSYNRLEMPRLYQVPVHIYPGMNTAPLPKGLSSLNQNRDPSQPRPSTFSIQLSPMQEPQANASTSRPSATKTTSQLPPLSDVLDLASLEGARVPTPRAEENGGLDQQVELDALWAWSGNTPTAESPTHRRTAAD